MTESASELTALANLPAGSLVEVVEFLGCHRRAQRLAELGMTPGTRLEILRRAHGQPLLLRVRGALLAVDQRSACDVIVRMLEDRTPPARRPNLSGRHGRRFRLGRGPRGPRRGR